MKWVNNGPPSWAIFVLAGAVFCAWLAGREEAAASRRTIHPDAREHIEKDAGVELADAG
jgi:hypothetical protein